MLCRRAADAGQTGPGAGCTSADKRKFSPARLKCRYYRFNDSLLNLVMRASRQGSGWPGRSPSWSPKTEVARNAGFPSGGWSLGPTTPDSHPADASHFRADPFLTGWGETPSSPGCSGLRRHSAVPQASRPRHDSRRARLGHYGPPAGVGSTAPSALPRHGDTLAHRGRLTDAPEPRPAAPTFRRGPALPSGDTGWGRCSCQCRRGGPDGPARRV